MSNQSVYFANRTFILIKSILDLSTNFNHKSIAVTSSKIIFCGNSYKTDRFEINPEKIVDLEFAKGLLKAKVSFMILRILSLRKSQFLFC